jgi:hypothetical protein
MSFRALLFSALPPEPVTPLSQPAANAPANTTYMDPRGVMIAVSFALGLLAWVSTEVSYWNWYSISFPLVAMGLLDSGPGFFLAGSFLGWQLRKSR